MQSRYDRIAPRYDRSETLMEWLGFARWRRKLWERTGNSPGGTILEVGVGTGKNMRFYPLGCRVTAVDLSPVMLARAQERAGGKNVAVGLALMDAEKLALADASFDTVVASFVFCSVADPMAGLREVARVRRPEGRVLLLEHVRSHNRLLGKLMDWMDPLVVRWGPGDHINRRTLDNVRNAGLYIEEAISLAPMGLVQLVVARPQ